MSRLRVGLVFGGPSVEHEVSVVSARGVSKALDRSRFEVVPLGVTGGGRWLSPEDSGRVLDSGAARVDGDAAAARVLVDPGSGGLVVHAEGGAPHRLALDVVFPVMHGWGGEDGRLQGLLDLALIPCVGPGVLGSAVGMDKQVAKALFEQAGIPVGPWRALHRGAWEADRAAHARRLVAELGTPLFVKPANGGSSVGISKVRAPEEIDAALALAFSLDRKVVIERGLDAREIECAVLGNDRPAVSVCGEIVPSREFYDYASKYQDGTSRLAIPAPLDPGVSDRIRALAAAAFRALDLSGMARVDFFLEKADGGVFLNEVNTLPGFTPISMYPKLWEASGLPYPDLLARLIDLARERFEDAGSRRTRRD
ncbi:MAG TPA: D-alanine--D-alanine ligase family protein [Candidatus Sulfotelmatobacter sp.]|jgi:D-alanine-D-alanine ligase|nr:D-alanine--D-alanine ligase family protein [Candidatus Sulfotelmatobacter sp.]